MSNSPLGSRRNISQQSAQATNETSLRQWLAEKVPQHTALLKSAESTHSVLRDGVILCGLANALSPGVITKVWTLNVGFKHIDNVNKFVTYLKLVGFPATNSFTSVELVEGTNIPGVVQSLLHFKDFAQKNNVVLSTPIPEDRNVTVTPRSPDKSDDSKKSPWKLQAEQKEQEEALEQQKRKEYLEKNKEMIQSQKKEKGKVLHVKDRINQLQVSQQQDMEAGPKVTTSVNVIPEAPTAEQEAIRKENEAKRAASLKQQIQDQREKDQRQEELAVQQHLQQQRDKKQSKDRQTSDGTLVGAGRIPGLEIWRIEQFEAVSWPKDQYGKFHTGDSYVILHTIRENGPWKIYFWLGEKSTHDEKGTAAYKTVELGDLLGGNSEQHREVQHHESGHFQSTLSNFGYSLEYLAGGISSGFAHVEKDVYPKKLFCVKGKHNVRIVPVEVTYQSMNSGDVFVLDAGLTLWHWNGTLASRREQIAGLRMTRRLCESRGSRPAVRVIEQGKEPDEFWISLGSAGPIKSASETISDESFDKVVKQNVKLYLVSDSTGEPRITIKASPPLKQTMLDSNDCFVLDIGTELFVWFGKKCTAQEKKLVVYHAHEILKKSGHPDWTPITHVTEDSEPPLFKEQFETWKDSPNDLNASHFITQHNDFKSLSLQVQQETKSSKVDAKKLDAVLSEKYVESTDPFDKYMELKGKLDIWRIENFQAAELPKDQWGSFYSGDSYIVLFTPEWEKFKPVIYYWIGRNSTQDERGAAAVLTTEIAKGTATHIRVVPGKEPNHFLHHFRGKFVIKIGGIASGYKNVTEKTVLNADDGGAHDDGKPHLYHVHGTTSFNTRTMEIECKSKNLNSSDTFIVIHSKPTYKQYLWYGSGSEPVEREFAAHTAEYLKKGRTVTPVIFEEGKESQEFWALLGGKQPYASDSLLRSREAIATKPPRLFHCWNAKGYFDLEEIYNFTQDDLLLEDVYVLDVFSSVFVWVGTDANQEEKIKSMETAIQYVERASKIDGRSLDQPIIKVLAGEEPPMFTCWFHAWEPQQAGIDIFKQYTLEQQKKHLDKERKKGESSDVRAEMEKIKKAQEIRVLPYSELRMDVNKRTISSHIDTKNLEKYLSDEEFQKLFQMSRDKFYTLPVWKQEGTKASLHLF